MDRNRQKGIKWTETDKNRRGKNITGHKWTDTERKGQKWTEKDRYRQKRTELDRKGHNWTGKAFRNQIYVMAQQHPTHKNPQS